MKKEFCDKCGKEIPFNLMEDKAGKITFYPNIKKIFSKNFTYHTDRLSYDLCGECFYELLSKLMDLNKSPLSEQPKQTEGRK